MRCTITACARHAEGRAPHPLFDSAYYLEENPDVAAAGIDPLVHFTHFGAFEGRNPHPLFDVGFYLSQNRDVAASGVNPLIHYWYGAGSERLELRRQCVAR